ncbi:MAG: C39 family peptidase [Chloroflexaceae bacterium]
MRRFVFIVFLLATVGGASLLVPGVRQQARGYARAVLRPEPPAPITPMPLANLPSVVADATAPPPASPTTAATATATAFPATATLEDTLVPSATLPAASPTPLLTSTATPLPSPTAPPEPVVINGRVYDAYIPAANKESQAYQYSCEFDAAWVIFQTYGLNVSVDEMIPVVGVDDRIEPYIGEATADGQIIYGGDITTTFSGDYTSNFLARSSGTAMHKLFEQYGLTAWPVSDRAGIEQALRQGALIWMKTTVDFKPWRPAIWHMPDGRTYRTVLGNDHAVVVMGFNEQVVVIRDVLGPTSSNWQRPYEYEVDWNTFMAAWGAQSFDGLAVAPPQ